MNVFVTHYVRAGDTLLNDVTLDVVREIEHVTTTPHRLTVLGWAEDDAMWGDLERKLAPHDVRLVRNDRAGRPDTQPSQRNKVIDVARGDGDEPFVLLHNDVRPARGWLDRLEADLYDCERRWGYASSIIAPRYVQFHRTDAPVWVKLESQFGDAKKSASDMAHWCAQYNIPFNPVDGRVFCLDWSPPSDSGHQLMMFVTRPSFFDAVGSCDETFTGKDYDDSEWGMRALMAGKRNLVSQSALMGHAEGLSFGAAGTLLPADNEKVFIAKWGQAIFDELRSGQLWIRLHQEQG
jgi:hypothetical protein